MISHLTLRRSDVLEIRGRVFEFIPWPKVEVKRVELEAERRENSIRAISVAIHVGMSGMQYRSTALKMSIRCYYLEKMFSVKLDYSR